MTARAVSIFCRCHKRIIWQGVKRLPDRGRESADGSIRGRVSSGTPILNRLSSHLVFDGTDGVSPKSHETLQSFHRRPSPMVCEGRFDMKDRFDSVDDSPCSGSLTDASLLLAVDSLKFFLATAPSSFDAAALDDASIPWNERCLKPFELPHTDEHISCVYWNGLFHITGTDIVRALTFRFSAFGRPVKNVKKFEEGVFSDLRNLKSGTDATLEDPKSDFLELLFKYNCIRTQKKQKVFYWFSVPHDRLFLDALDRDLKREKLGMEATTHAVAEPALSFVHNPSKSLYEQFAKGQVDLKSLPRMESAVNEILPMQGILGKRGHAEAFDFRPASPVMDHATNTVFGAVSLFEGSPSYKQRRKQATPSSRMTSESHMQREDDVWSASSHGAAVESAELPTSSANSRTIPASSLRPVVPDFASYTDHRTPYGARFPQPSAFTNSLAVPKPHTPLANGVSQPQYMMPVHPWSELMVSPHSLHSLSPKSSSKVAACLLPLVSLEDAEAADSSSTRQTLSLSPDLANTSTTTGIAQSFPTTSFINSVWTPFQSPRVGAGVERELLNRETMPRAGSVDYTRKLQEAYPIARRHRSATPSVRQNRTSLSHPVLQNQASSGTDIFATTYTSDSAANAFSDQLATINCLNRTYVHAPSQLLPYHRFEIGSHGFEQLPQADCSPFTLQAMSMSMPVASRFSSPASSPASAAIQHSYISPRVLEQER